MDQYVGYDPQKAAQLLAVNSHIGWYNHVRNVDFEVSRSGVTGYQAGMWIDT